MQETKSNLPLIISAIVAILLIGSIVALAMNSNKPSSVVKDTINKSSDLMSKDMSSKKNEMMSKVSEVMMKPDSSKMSPDESQMMKKEDSMMTKDDKMMKGEESSPKGNYSQYSVTNLAQNSAGTNVIFFHAPWCPSCKAIDAEINSNLSALPANFQILKADFDTSTALKQKYGITSQSTFVKVDKDGNKIGSTSPAFQLKTVDDIVGFGNK